MNYQAKEAKLAYLLSHRMRNRNIAIGKSTGCVRFFLLDDHLEIEEKLWHPLIILKYLIICILYVPLIFMGGQITDIGFNSFRSKHHPTAKRITGKQEIAEAIKKDRVFRDAEFAKQQWV